MKKTLNLHNTQVRNLPILNKIVEQTELSNVNNMSLDEEDKENYMCNKELSTEEIIEKQNKTREIELKMKELEEEKEKIEDEINKENKLKGLYEYFKNPRNEFVFKITYSDDNFREQNVKNYLSAIVKGISNQNAKIIKWKTLCPYVWFKTDQHVLIRWVKKSTDPKSELTSFTMLQLRPDKFFEYI